MPVAQLDRPAPDIARATCLACDRRAAVPGALCCAGCRIQMSDDLTRIPPLYARLDADPGSGRADGSRGAPGFRSTSPARDDVLVLLDGRQQTFDPDHLLRPSGIRSMLRYWLDQADLAGWASVAGCCADLHRNLDRLSKTWWVGDMAAALRAAVRHLEHALGEAEASIPLGDCPAPMAGAKRMVFDAEADVWVQQPILCGGQVRARAMGQKARCVRCGARWEGLDELRELGRTLGDAMLDMPGLARYLGVQSMSTLRTWAERDDWPRERVGGRTRYSLTAALDSAFAAWDRKHPVYGPVPPPLDS